jgi:hypothetical protein
MSVTIGHSTVSCGRSESEYAKNLIMIINFFFKVNDHSLKKNGHFSMFPHNCVLLTGGNCGGSYVILHPSKLLQPTDRVMRL